MRQSSLSRKGSLSRANSGRTGRTRSGSKAGLNLLAIKPVAVQSPKRTAVGIDAAQLVDRLESAERGRPLLVVDVRNLTAFLGDAGRIRGSV